MGYYGYAPYVSAAEKKEIASKKIAKMMKKNPDIQPITIDGNIIAKSWWGKTWNKNLESYADYKNRIERGKAYVRSNCVIDLKISQGTIKAMVLGSGKKPYDVIITIDTLSSVKLDKVIKLCNNEISSLEQLLDGKFPKELEILFTDKKYGLFPSPNQIHFDCSCPDYASMCKHVAAVLYGIGNKFDNDPMLFFTLRNIEASTLIKKSIDDKLDSMLKNAGKRSEREINENSIFDIFGV